MLRTAIALSLALVFPVVPVQAAQDGATVPSESITYSFDNAKFLISKIELVVTGYGGRLEFSRQGLAVPVTRPIRITPATAAALRERFDRLGFLGSTEVYQTKEDHSNLGTTTIGVRRGEAGRSVSFNYTANRDMTEISSMLRGIANREILAFDIETAIQFQPLELPKLIDSLSSELRLGRVTDVELMAPLIEEVADDPTLPLIARNNARKILDSIRK